MASLFGNQPDASWAWSGDFDSGHTRGSKFRVTAAGAISAVGFYRAGTGATFAKLMLFHEDTTMLWSSSSPTDDVTFGWKWTAVDPPIPVTTGVSYYVCANFQGSQNWATNTTPATRAAPPAEFMFDDLPHWWAGGINECPTYASVANFFSLSVTLGAAPEPVPGPGEGDPTTTGDLNSWLSADPDVQTHEADGLPWLTKLQTDVIENAVAAGRIVIDATHDIVELIPKRGDSEWNAILKLWQIAGVLTEAEIDLWDLFAKRAPHQLTGSTPGGGSAFFGPSGGQVAERAEVAATNGAHLWHRTQTTNWLDALPGGDWVLQDTLEFDAPFAWNQPADVYVVHITTWPLVFGEEEVAGLRYLPRAFWWAPLTGTIPHERHFGDFEFQAVHNLPLRCEGIVCRPRENVTGTIEAWLRPEPLPGIPVPPVP